MSFDFDLAEDLRLVRGAIDSQAWVLNNVHNAGSERFRDFALSARLDAQRGRAALERIEARFASTPETGSEEE